MSATQSYRIVLAHGGPDGGSTIAGAIRSMGHGVEAVVRTAGLLVDAATRCDPDLLIASTELDDGPAVDALIQLSADHPRPAIVIAPNADGDDVQEALQDHVMAFLVEPVDEQDLRPAIELVMVRFREFQDLREEVEGLQAALKARKVIERAKGILMKEHGLDEATAFRRLQRSATDGRTKLVGVAEAIVQASEDGVPGR